MLKTVHEKLASRLASVHLGRLSLGVNTIGCTVILFSTSEHGPILGKNGDYVGSPSSADIDRLRSNCAIVHRDYSEGVFAG